MTKRSRPTNTEWESDVVKAPEKQGLYDPRNEHDACGMGFVANIKGEQTNEIIRDSLQILANASANDKCGTEDAVQGVVIAFAQGERVRGDGRERHFGTVA